MRMLQLNKRRTFLQAVFTLFVVMAIIAGCATPAQQTAAPTAVVTEPPAPATEAPVVTEPPVTTEPAATEPAATEPAATEPAATEPAATEAGPRMELANLSPDIPDPSEPVVVTFASWVGGGEAWQHLAEEFHALHPNITIEFQDVPFEEMHDKLLTQVAANNPPDTAFVDGGIVSEFATRKALVNLDDYVSKSTAIDREDYVPAFIQAATVEGSLYGLPIDGETTGLFYRTDRFEEAGLDPNHPPETWEEFKEYAEKLTDPANKKYGFIVFAPEAAYYWYPWLWQAGGDTLNPDDPNDVIWDSPEGQKAANFYVDLAKYSPPDFLNSNSWDGRVAFANGDVAMYEAGAWFAGTLVSEFPDANGKWSAAPLPKDQRCATTVASDHLVIFNASKNPEAAFKWLEFVSHPSNMAVLNTGTPEAPATLLPPRISLLEDPSLFEGRPFLQGFAENMKCAVVSDVVQPRYGEMEQFLNEKLGEAFYGQYPDGATAVQEAAQEAEDIVKQ